MSKINHRFFRLIWLSYVCVHLVKKYSNNFNRFCIFFICMKEQNIEFFFFSSTISPHSLFLFYIRISNLKRYFKFLKGFSWNLPIFRIVQNELLFPSHMNEYLFFAQTVTRMWKDKTTNVLQGLDNIETGNCDGYLS
jgi:hypothetical protein